MRSVVEERGRFFSLLRSESDGDDFRDLVGEECLSTGNSLSGDEDDTGDSIGSLE